MRTLDIPRPKNVLVVRLSALGDVLHCLPAVAALRQLWPDAAIDWVCETLGASIIVGHPHIRNVHQLPRNEWSRLIREPGRWPELSPEVGGFLTELRRQRYDVVIDLQGNLRSRAVSLATRHSVRVGHHRRDVKEHSWLLPGRTPPREFEGTGLALRHRVEKNLHLIRFLGFRGPTPAGRLPDYGDATRSFRRALAPGGEQSVVLHPFVSAFGRFKEWPPGHFASLARGLAKEGRQIWLSWGPGDRAGAEAIADASHGHAQLAPATGSPRALAAMLSAADLVVAADTGPLHLAAAAGKPVIGLFGPKDPEVYGPWNTRRDSEQICRVVRADLPCSPCRLRSCEHALCMEALTPNQVLTEAEELLAGLQITS